VYPVVRIQQAACFKYHIVVLPLAHRYEDCREPEYRLQAVAEVVAGGFSENAAMESDRRSLLAAGCGGRAAGVGSYSHCSEERPGPGHGHAGAFEPAHGRVELDGGAVKSAEDAVCS